MECGFYEDKFAWSVRGLAKTFVMFQIKIRNHRLKIYWMHFCGNKALQNVSTTFEQMSLILASDCMWIRKLTLFLS